MRLLAVRGVVRLELERGVLDVEVLCKALLELREERRRPALLDQLRRHSDVRREHGSAAGQLPDVHIVDTGHAVEGLCDRADAPPTLDLVSPADRAPHLSACLRHKELNLAGIRERTPL